MSNKEDIVEIEGEVTELLRDAMFRVKLKGGTEIIAHTSGKIRKVRVRILVGDMVLVEISPYGVGSNGIGKGRIIRRLSGTS